ncbi:MAG: hypothetical protein WA317_01485 [Mycobacterium sp.]|uniref:hypothetical protein n=1 Tax=Mycobacterium sp. TaxID=1785 RepID=UPI003CC68C91
MNTAYRPGLATRGVEPLDAVDADELYSEVADYASEYDPGTWDDNEIWEAIARLAERDAHTEDANYPASVPPLLLFNE